MNKKIYSMLAVLLMATLMVSTASAGGAIKFSSVTFDLGSLIASGFASGLGNTDVTVVLDASGIPAITCTNYGSNDVPGQSYPKVSAVGQQDLLGSDGRSKNGKTPFSTETNDPETLPWDEAGCPNSNWTAHVDFIFWTDATLSVYDMYTGELLASQSYTCTTTRYPASVSCTLVK
ncbi:MAG: hypothetical protein C3F07_14050 [Anaerolineales bacterium]|nr:hypothetical protein [Anaerolineae bacterium]PWB71500.1 MAG: hypothetical protein C3F07_14050 [Anaerolineales bacterium]